MNESIHMNTIKSQWANTYEYYPINGEIINHIKILRDLRLMSSALVSKSKNGKA